MIPINVDLHGSFITQGCATRIFRTIMEQLLFHRGQIPHVYSVFRTMVKNLSVNEVDASVGATGTVASVQLKKQREQARQVVSSTELLIETVDKILANDPAVRELMILFGKTIYTAKEAFVIKLPTINPNHYGYNHQHALVTNLRTIGMQLVCCDELSSDTTVLLDTNVFVMVRSAATNESSFGWKPLDFYQLPKKCVHYIINLQLPHVDNDQANYRCCKQMPIFQEHNENDTLTVNVIAAKEENEQVNDTWHLLDTVISGFKTKFIKGISIWE